MVCFNTYLNEIISEKVEMLFAGILCVLLFLLMPMGIWFTAYVLFYTKYWYIALVYLAWIWIIDRHSATGVSRGNVWLRSCSVFKHAALYFPVKLHAKQGFSLDPKRNYLAGCFPHGLMPTGIILASLVDSCGLRKLAPHHKLFGVTLNCLFFCPIYRDFLLSLGVCNANAESIEHIVTNPGGGKIAGLFPGGAAEMFHCHGGEYKLELKNRKGFIKLSLRTGTPLIPVFSFGETSIYRQIAFSKGSLFRRFQDWFKDTVGFPPIIFYGRGFFQTWFGIIPMKTPINIVVGYPIEVIKTANPTQDEIDALHENFVGRLTALFEEYKHRYEPHPDKSFLIII